MECGHVQPLQQSIGAIVSTVMVLIEVSTILFLIFRSQVARFAGSVVQESSNLPVVKEAGVVLIDGIKEMIGLLLRDFLSMSLSHRVMADGREDAFANSFGPVLRQHGEEFVKLVLVHAARVILVHELHDLVNGHHEIVLRGATVHFGRRH